MAPCGLYQEICFIQSVFLRVQWKRIRLRHLFFFPFWNSEINVGARFGIQGSKHLHVVMNLGDVFLGVVWKFAVDHVHCLHGPVALVVAITACSGTPGQLLAQEAVRMSLAGEAAAEARRSAALAPDYYNIRLGPIAWSLAAGLDLEANDNIRFDSRDAKADLTLRPQLDSRMNWRISDKNSINLAVGAGYSAYLQHSELDRFFVAPDSELSLDLYAGDFWLNLHERLSITKNAYQDPTVIGTADYSQLQNSVGLTSTWDLNKLVIKVGYDHANYSELTGGGVPDGQSEISSLSAGYHFGPEIEAGLESGGGVTRYSGANTMIKEASDWNAGAFLETQPLEHIRLRAGVGYTLYSPQASGGQVSAAEFAGVYARLGLNHRLNKFVEYDLNGGRNISFGFFGGTIDLYNAALQVRWHLFQKISLGTWFGFEHGSQVLIGRETFDRFGPGLSLERPITRKMSGSVRYQYYQRRSDIPGGDYAVNIVTMSFAYRL
jgi:hypothetical protein